VKNIALVSMITASLALPITGHAEEQPAHSISGNLGIFSNYIFRGVTQTSEKAALQGGFDYAHKSGAYAGVWGSNISWLSDSALYTASSLEMDVYGGYKATIGSSDFGYDVGAIVYYYPGTKGVGSDNANTAEVYVGGSWKWITVKVSYAPTEYFGVVKSDGTRYADVSASYPIGKSGVTLLAHVGSLKVSGTGNGIFDYTDWKVGVNYALPKDFTVGAFFTDTDAKAASYTILGTNWADKQAGIFVSKTF